jgi:hypothetical protein
VPEREPTLEDHHETLYGSPRHPEWGLVKRFEELDKSVAPIVKFWKDVQWPARIIMAGLGLALSGWVVDLVKGLIRFLAGPGESGP